MGSLLFSLPELFNSYKAWVSKNPTHASDYETTAKWVSYFVAGRINNSYVVSELVYCLSNLLVLFNDGIIRKTCQLQATGTAEKIKLWLTVVEYSEVFCELSFQKLWGKRGKWLIVVVIQVFKCIGRLLLLYKHKESIIDNPPIRPLDRIKLGKDKQLGKLTDLGQSELGSFSFTLKRSGRVVRKVESSPPISLRNWKPLEAECQDKISIENNGAILKAQLVAETLYIAKPIVHLVSLKLFGTKAWKPWMIAMALDLASLQLYKFTQKSSKALTKKQKLQLSKRTVLMLLYLIRSPFYEKHSEDKIKAFLVAISNNVPFIRLVTHPLMQYIPFWQSSYFYMWST